MNAEYDRRQRAAKWPRRWSPNGLPDWYRDLLAEMTGKLIVRHEHDPGQHLDPRTDPRPPRHRAGTERRNADR
jgi:hypothetical protein